MFRTVLVTGSTDGIGRETALQLWKLGHSVILHGRSETRLASVRNEILSSSVAAVPPSNKNNKQSLSTVCVDFSSLRDVSRATDAIIRDFPHISALINNAAVWVPSEKRTVTSEGVELGLAVNHLSPVLLTNRLLPVLRKNASARIVNISSISHAYYPNGILGNKEPFDFDNMNAEKKFDPYHIYSQAKLLNLFFTTYLARREVLVTANACDPGTVGPSKLVRAVEDHLQVELPQQSLSGAASAIVHVAVSPEVEGVSGKYFFDCKEQRTSALAQDTETAEKVMRLSEEMIRKALKV